MSKITNFVSIDLCYTVKNPWEFKNIERPIVKVMDRESSFQLQNGQIRHLCVSIKSRMHENPFDFDTMFATGIQLAVDFPIFHVSHLKIVLL